MSKFVTLLLYAVSDGTAKVRAYDTPPGEGPRLVREDSLANMTTDWEDYQADLEADFPELPTGA